MQKSYSEGLATHAGPESCGYVGIWRIRKILDSTIPRCQRTIIAWRVFWLCMINRIAPDSDAKTVFTKIEMQLLDQLVPVKNKSQKKTIEKYLTRLAKLGGYLDRSHDPPPGNMVVWRGFRRQLGK